MCHTDHFVGLVRQLNQTNDCRVESEFKINSLKTVIYDFVGVVLIYKILNYLTCGVRDISHRNLAIGGFMEIR